MDATMSNKSLDQKKPCLCNDNFRQIQQIKEATARYEEQKRIEKEQNEPVRRELRRQQIREATARYRDRKRMEDQRTKTNQHCRRTKTLQYQKRKSVRLCNKKGTEQRQRHDESMSRRRQQMLKKRCTGILENMRSYDEGNFFRITEFNPPGFTEIEHICLKDVEKLIGEPKYRFEDFVSDVNRIFDNAMKIFEEGVNGLYEQASKLKTRFVVECKRSST